MAEVEATVVVDEMGGDGAAAQEFLDEDCLSEEDEEDESFLAAEEEDEEEEDEEEEFLSDIEEEFLDRLAEDEGRGQRVSQTTANLHKLLMSVSKMTPQVQLQILSAVTESVQQQFMQEASIAMAEQVRRMCEAATLYSDAAELSPMKRPRKAGQRSRATARKMPAKAMIVEETAGAGKRVEDRKSFVRVSKVYDAPNKIIPPVSQDSEPSRAPRQGKVLSTSAAKQLAGGGSRGRRSKRKKGPKSAKAVLADAFDASRPAPSSSTGACSHAMIRGPRKGEPCGKRAAGSLQGQSYCKQHLGLHDGTSKSAEKPAAAKSAAAAPKVTYQLTGACHLCTASVDAEEGDCVQCEAARIGDTRVKALKHRETRTEGDASGFLKLWVHKGEASGLDSYRISAWQLVFVTMDTSFDRWEERGPVFARLRDLVVRGETVEWLPIVGNQKGREYYQLLHLYDYDLRSQPVDTLPSVTTAPIPAHEPEKTEPLGTLSPGLGPSAPAIPAAAPPAEASSAREEAAPTEEPAPAPGPPVPGSGHQKEAPAAEEVQVTQPAEVQPAGAAAEDHSSAVSGTEANAESSSDPSADTAVPAQDSVAMEGSA